MNLEAFDYELPDELVAQHPAERRDASRLMILDAGASPPRHRSFSDLAAELEPGDLVVVNDTRVIPARLRGRKPTGGAVELLLVERDGGAEDAQEWTCLIDASRPPRAGDPLELRGGLVAEVLGRAAPGWRVRLRAAKGTLAQALEDAGEIPLPPYIRRDDGAATIAQDAERYQTVYAAHPGAIAAPTAGLHFTEQLLDALESRGVGVAHLTLHVGPGTFLPVRAENVEQHRMHPEAFAIPEATSSAIAEARSKGSRVVAVGTTVVRALESACSPDGRVRPGAGRTDLFVVPGFRFRVVDVLVTNFHLPRSTLLMLVAAFGGLERILDAYATAVRERYRFYSYGDAMLVRRG